MSDNAKGRLIIIGGHEDRKGDSEILQAVADDARRGSGRLAVLTVASEQPQKLAAEYRNVFGRLEVPHVEVVDIRAREDATDEKRVAAVAKADVIFFTGGDQLRITSQIGDSPLYQTIMDRFLDGATIVGTSAGAAAMPATMIVSGNGDESAHISALGMAPGLGLLPDVVIDSHFAERGRMGRLIGAVTQNPRNLGLGIDEDTAVLVAGVQFSVLGSGAVYVLDGSGVSYSSLSVERAEGVITVHNLCLHVLGKDDRFDLSERLPLMPEQGTK